MIAGPAVVMAVDVPKDYVEVKPSDNLDKYLDKHDKHDSMCIMLVELYRKEKACKIYVPKKKGEDDKRKNADIIISCTKEGCPHFIIIIEVKSGTTGVEKAPSQIEDAAKAAEDAGLLSKNPTKEELEKCIHLILYATKVLKTPGKINDAEIQTGSEKKKARVVYKTDDLPKP
jgi:hypothetical protein